MRLIDFDQCQLLQTKWINLFLKKFKKPKNSHIKLRLARSHQTQSEVFSRRLLRAKASQIINQSQASENYVNYFI